MKRIASLLPFAVVLLLAGCSAPQDGASSQQRTEAPRSVGGTTDAPFDWEHPPSQPARNRTWSELLTFKSTKTLEQTSLWLQWAIERYGHVQQPAWKTDVSDVRFRGCSMEWTELQVGHGVTRESRYSVPLSSVDLKLKAVHADSEGVKFSLITETEIGRRYIEKGREKGSRREKEGSVLLEVRDEDVISDRIAWALVHASRLCGAKTQTEYR